MSIKVLSLGVFGMLCWMGWMPLSARAQESHPPAAMEKAGTEKAHPEPAAAKKAERPVEKLDLDWLDHRRDRHIPVRIYYPKSATQPLPVIIFSHGLGGSRVGYAFLGQYWADHGYVAVHLQHKGSDTAVWQNAGSPMTAMREAARDQHNTLERPRDVTFAIDQLAELQRGDGPLHGRLDLQAIGVAGHSMGAQTALLIAGQAFITAEGQEITLADPRVKAIVALSPPVRRSKDQPNPFDKIYGSIRLPCLHFTGTKDESPLGLTAAKDRRVPFDHIHAADQYLVILQDGDHMIFTERRRSHGGPDVETVHNLLSSATTAFWDAYLKDDLQAMVWLGDGALRTTLGKTGTLEVKPKADAAAAKSK